MAQTRRSDWIERGFGVLRDHGEAALTIQRLCDELGRTKGAFYHHFADASAFADALLTAWEEVNTSAPITRAESASALRDKRDALAAAVRAIDAPLDLAVRAWGLRDARAGEFVRRVDERRVGYLASLYPTSIPAQKRRALARLEYAAFVGAIQLFPSRTSAPAREVERLLAVALSKLMRDPDA